MNKYCKRFHLNPLSDICKNTGSVSSGAVIHVSKMVAHFHTAALCNRHFIAQYCHERRAILRDHKEMILQKCVCSVRAELKFLAVSNIVNRSLVFVCLFVCFGFCWKLKREDFTAERLARHSSWKCLLLHI